MAMQADAFTSPAMAKSQIVVWTGDEALQRVALPDFIEEWQALYSACSWATPFQSPEFVTAWYECYQKTHEAILVARLGSQGQLQCLLPLARRHRDREVCGAGAQQACCQVWLAREESDGLDFLKAAWATIQHEHPGTLIRLRYLPFSIKEGSIKRASLHWIARPRHVIQHVISLDLERVNATLLKKQNRKRLRKLTERGVLAVTPLGDIADPVSFLEELASQGDLNKGAGYGVSAFREDSAKMPFHVRLLGSPHILRGAALTVNGELAAGALGLVGHGRVYHTLSGYSPVFGDFSPSRILLMGLNKNLADEGWAEFLPSPGDDEWKQQTSDEVRQVSELTLYPSAVAAKRDDLGALLRLGGKRVLGAAGLKPERMRVLASKALALTRKLTLQHMLSIPNHLWKHVELRVYRLDLSGMETPSSSGRFRKNTIQDLVCFEPGEKWQSRQQFLRSASQRLQEGEIAYTCGEDGRLFHCTWLVPRQEKAFFNAVGMEFDFPAGTAVIYDAYTFPTRRGKGLWGDCMRQIIRDIMEETDATQIMMCAVSDNGPSRHVIESLGFRHDCSLHCLKTPFSTKRWRTEAP